jgi:hypothetical protein
VIERENLLDPHRRAMMMRRIAPTVISLIAIGLAGPSSVRADLIPYPNMGHYNSTTYTFVAASTGDVIGYFAGTDALFDNQVGLLVNGVLTPAGYGLDDHSSSIGQAFDFGHVNAGDTLVFDLHVLSLGAHVYSYPSLNVPYDAPGETVGHNHVYSTAYTATSPILDSIPVGRYLAFEDQSFPNSDYSYADENFVFTNVQLAPVPEPAGLISAGLGLGGLGIIAILRRWRRSGS